MRARKRARHRWRGAVRCGGEDGSDQREGDPSESREICSRENTVGEQAEGYRADDQPRAAGRQPGLGHRRSRRTCVGRVEAQRPRPCRQPGDDDRATVADPAAIAYDGNGGDSSEQRDDPDGQEGQQHSSRSTAQRPDVHHTRGDRQHQREPCGETRPRPVKHGTPRIGGRRSGTPLMLRSAPISLAAARSGDSSRPPPGLRGP